MSCDEGYVVICRACNNECVEYKNIYRQGIMMGELTTLSNMLSYCTNLEFPEDEDFMPGNLCSECIQNLAKLYAFKQTVHKSNEMFRQQHCDMTGNILEDWQQQEEVVVGVTEIDGEQQEAKQELDHSYVTLTIVNDGKHHILNMQQSSIMGDDSHPDGEQMENQQLEEIFDSDEHEVIYQEMEEEQEDEQGNEEHEIDEEQFKVEGEEDEFGSEYEIAVQLTNNNSQENSSVAASDVETTESNVAVKRKAQREVAEAMTKRLKVVKPRLKPSGRKPPANPNFQCQVCNKQLSNTNSYRYHMQLHSDATPFLCSLCGEGFKTRNAYDGHMSLHDPNNPNTCDLCGKSYRQSSSLRSHMLTHTGEKPFQCDICGKGMTQKSGYKKHMLTHTGEKPHTCDICGRDFRYSSNLISHKRHHTGEKPYDCPLCEKCFPTSEQLKRHTLVHTGEKPFSCTVCQKRFNRRSTLSAHQLTHENSAAGKGKQSAKDCIKREAAPQVKCVEHY